MIRRLMSLSMLCKHAFGMQRGYFSNMMEQGRVCGKITSAAQAVGREVFKESEQGFDMRQT